MTGRKIKARMARAKAAPAAIKPNDLNDCMHRVAAFMAGCVYCLREQDRASVLQSLREGGRLRFVVEADADDITAVRLHLVGRDGVSVWLTEVKLSYVAGASDVEG
mgnify:CR=1 FL=1